LGLKLQHNIEGATMLHAAFDIVRERSDFFRVVIRDTDGPRSVTNDAEWVIDRLVNDPHLLGGNGIRSRRVFYYDTQGDLGELIHDGEKFIRFGPATEADIEGDGQIPTAVVGGTPSARALRLADHVMKTWNPPLKGAGGLADVSQTSVMQTIAYIMGPEFLPDLTENQQAAIDSGMELMRKVVG
jgi:hypothetical protein